MALSDQTIIDQLAAQERSISGVKNSYNFAQNPDDLSAAVLPAVIHYSPSFESIHKGHFNLWTTTVIVKSVLFVAPRESKGGKLRFLENTAIPFGQLWRAKFQDNSVISTLISNTGAQRFFLDSGIYGAGGDDLLYGDVAYLGWIFQFSVTQSG